MTQQRKAKETGKGKGKECTKKRRNGGASVVKRTAAVKTTIGESKAKLTLPAGLSCLVLSVPSKGWLRRLVCAEEKAVGT